jgi:hypothetical protein
MSKVWIGTSGWTYDRWRGPFYPPDVAKAKWLCWYADQFPTTQINGSFYRTPSLKAVAVWRDKPRRISCSRGPTKKEERGFQLALTGGAILFASRCSRINRCCLWSYPLLD